MGSTAQAAAVGYPGKATEISCHGLMMFVFKKQHLKQKYTKNASLANVKNAFPIPQV